MPTCSHRRRSAASPARRLGRSTSAISATCRAPPARSLDVDDRIDAAHEVVADGAQRPRRRGLDDERLETVHRVEGAVGMARRPRAVVSGVQCLDETEDLAAADLADDEAVGPQPQGRVQELLDA